MKITHNKIGQNLNIKDNVKAESLKNAKATQESKRVGPTDLAAAKAADQTKNNLSNELKISNQARVFAQAKEIAQKTPDVNQDKVQRIKQMVQEGKYKVDAEALADKMLKEEIDFADL